MQRIIAGDTCISVRDIKELLKKEFIEIISKKAAEIGSCRGVINSCINIEPNILKRIAKKMVKEFDIKFLIIDYIQLIQAKGETQNVRVTNISHGIKSIAKELNIPVIALSQLSRLKKEEGNRKPILQDLKDSGSLEADADVVIFIHRKNEPNDEKTEETKLIIAKRRDGECGIKKVLFVKKRMKFFPESYEFKDDKRIK